MSIIGHQKIIKLLGRAIAKKAVSHAYLFSGPESVGKRTVALDFAEKLTGAHKPVTPDLIILSPEIEENKGIIKKKDIKIEKIRELRHQLGLYPQDGEFKVAIIDDAHRMNKAAQNALLKTLEEAEAGIVVILVVQDEKKMLPTIISRCQKVKFGTVSSAEIEENLSGNADKKDIVFWSLGRPGIMKTLVEDKEELSFRQESSDQLKKALKGDVGEKFHLAEDLGKNAELAAKKLNLWMILLREAILGNLTFAIDGNKALILIDEMGESLDTIKNTNANSRLVLENLFLNF